MTRGPSRRRLLLGSLPLCLVLLGFAGKVAVMERANSEGRLAYAAGDFAASRDAFDRNHPVNVLERWVAPFNSGAAGHRAGDYGGAVDDFTQAVRTVPHARECTVRINLAMSQERIGDLAVTAHDLVGARTAYQAGRLALLDGHCPTAAGEGAAQTRAARVLDAELVRKLSELPRQPTTTPTPTPSPSPTRSSEQDRQLQQNNQDGEQQRQDTEQLNDGAGNGPEGYHW